MARYHDTGTECKAELRACPLGLSESDHIEAANSKEFQEKLEKLYSSKVTINSREIYSAPLEDLISDKALKKLITNPRLEELRQERERLDTLIALPYDSDEFKATGFLKKDLVQKRRAVVREISSFKDQVASKIGEVFEDPQEREFIGNPKFKLAGEYPSNSPYWHLQRQKTVGGSDVGGILAIDENWGLKNLQQVEKAKTRRIELGDDPLLVPIAHSAAANRGNLWEPALVELASKTLGEDVFVNKGTFTDGKRHANLDGFTANPDGTIKAIVECKTSWSASEWEGGRVPKGYQLQVQHYMDCLGAEEAYIAVNIDDKDFKMVRITPEDSISGSAHTKRLYPELTENFTYRDAKSILQKFMERVREIREEDALFD